MSDNITIISESNSTEVTATALLGTPVGQIPYIATANTPIVVLVTDMVPDVEATGTVEDGVILLSESGGAVAPINGNSSLESNLNPNNPAGGGGNASPALDNKPDDEEGIQLVATGLVEWPRFVLPGEEANPNPDPDPNSVTPTVPTKERPIAEEPLNFSSSPDITITIQEGLEETFEGMSHVTVEKDPPASIFQEVLIDNLIGGSSSGLQTDWPTFVSNMPDTPDNCIVILDTAGILFGRYGVDNSYSKREGFQILVRSVDYPTGRSKIEEIVSYLIETISTPFNYETEGSRNYRINSIQQAGTILHLGKEVPTSKRSLFSCNFTVSVDWLEN